MEDYVDDYVDQKFDIEDIDITENKISTAVNYLPRKSSVPKYEKIKKEMHSEDIKNEPVDLDLSCDEESFMEQPESSTPRKKHNSSQSENLTNRKTGKKLFSDKTANMALIECAICKEGVRVMRQHVRQRHDITIAEYSEKYPDVRYALEMYHRY
jgi:hypothetical protein